MGKGRQVGRLTLSRTRKRQRGEKDGWEQHCSPDVPGCVPPAEPGRFMLRAGSGRGRE